MIEERLHKNCLHIIELIAKHVIPRVDKRHRELQVPTVEERAFFYKMVGDYNRYASESASSQASKTRLPGFKQGALDAYSKSLELCSRPESGIKPYNSVKLGLALNFSVFHYEVMNNHKQACELGEQALSDALEKIDDVDEETFRDAKSIIELLKENLSLWKEEEEQNNVEDL